MLPENAQPLPKPDDTERSQSSGSTLHLIDELEDAVANKDLRKRTSLLRRVTDLFMVTGTGHSAEHIALFDDVMTRLAAAVETSARAELGGRLAGSSSAPPQTLRALALDDAIAVAGPVLSHSLSIDESVLVESAKTKSQGHLLAISKRQSIPEVVTDVLVERGDREVLASTAGNSGARFSDSGAAVLASRAGEDIHVAKCFWERSDIPRQHLLSFCLKASETVREQLEAAVPAKAELYRYVVAEAANRAMAAARESSTEYQTARQQVEALHRCGQLDEVHLKGFAKSNKFEALAVALSLLADLPIGHVERAMVHKEIDQLLVISKALGLSWDTVSAIVAVVDGSRDSDSLQARAYRASFEKLQVTTAKSAIQFYRLRAQAME